MTNAEILRAVSHGLKLYPLMTTSDTAILQMNMGNVNVTKADLILQLCDGNISGVITKKPHSFLTNHFNHILFSKFKKML